MGPIILSSIQWNRSLVDNNGTYTFVQYSEVSLLQELLMYRNQQSIGTMESAQYIIDVLNPGVSINMGFSGSKIRQCYFYSHLLSSSMMVTNALLGSTVILEISANTSGSEVDS